ncbi:hypothetical protein COB52_01020 [Candidatus Kaiserbacteria bacterium]|nr:MAG: hypothetical protein COB52_01020 [Candidatus Kaiserbacteria bacterium]
MRKPSFFEKLTGSITPSSYDDLFESETPSAIAEDDDCTQEVEIEHESHEEQEEEVQEGELSVDIYQTQDEIVVKALIAGVTPNSVDISLTRDMITIRGNREEHREVEGENYFYKELYWGSFARTILLPEEVDVDSADASTTHGILIIRLPKINKERKTKLKVKAR